MTAFLLSKACIEAGLPKGVLNIVHGRWEKVGLPLADHPGIRALAFVGDSATGATLATRLAGSFKKLSFTLSGKNPNLIFEDCHFDQMMVGTLRSSFSNNGQLSFSGSRIFVQRPIYEKFREQLVKRTQFLKVGDPFSAVTDLGALISREHKERVLSYLALAEVEGGKILCGGQSLDLQGELEKGFFLRPAVIEGLPVDCRTNQEEIFGPVVTIAPFDTEEEAVALANASDYGLSATVWSQDIRKALRVAEKIRAGMVWINGWMVQDLRPSMEPGKQSGINRDGGTEALQFFSENKTICVKY
jgi:aminomuconate-semialdehyde/2-hydroxymuconate-6-semialdehyde dehydrogenase